MKTAIIILLTLSFANFAFACKTYESQVKGQIIEKTVIEESLCEYKVVIEKFNSHIFCPLAPSEIEDANIEGSCDLEKGNDFYSIIVYDGEKYYFD